MCTSEEIIQNILNINQATQSRHGIMCIGPPMSGKTTAIKLLVEALKVIHVEEFRKKSNLFLKKKAEMLEISTCISEGVIMSNSHDPIIE